MPFIVLPCPVVRNDSFAVLLPNRYEGLFDRAILDIAATRRSLSGPQTVFLLTKPARFSRFVVWSVSADLDIGGANAARKFYNLTFGVIYDPSDVVVLGSELLGFWTVWKQFYLRLFQGEGLIEAVGSFVDVYQSSDDEIYALSRRFELDGLINALDDRLRSPFSRKFHLYKRLKIWSKYRNIAPLVRSVGSCEELERFLQVCVCPTMTERSS